MVNTLKVFNVSGILGIMKTFQRQNKIYIITFLYFTIILNFQLNFPTLYIIFYLKAFGITN